MAGPIQAAPAGEMLALQLSHRSAAWMPSNPDHPGVVKRVGASGVLGPALTGPLTPDGGREHRHGKLA